METTTQPDAIAAAIAATRADFAAVLDTHAMQSADDVLAAVAESIADVLQPADRERFILRATDPRETQLRRAEELGADAGRAAASWYFDGNTSRETYAAVLRGIEEGDPQVMDTLPGAPLSGEWADEPTPASVLEELGAEPDEDGADELLSAYEEAYSTAAHDAIETAARYQLAP